MIISAKLVRGSRPFLGPRHFAGAPRVNTKSVRLYKHMSVRQVCLSVCPSANFNIECNFFTVRDRAFIFGMSVPYDKSLSDGTINFEHVTLTVTCDLLLKNLNIGYNFFILRDGALIFCMCVPYDKVFPLAP